MKNLDVYVRCIINLICCMSSSLNTGKAITVNSISYFIKKLDCA